MNTMRPNVLLWFLNESVSGSVNRSFKLGNCTLQETKEYTHLGVLCDPFMSNKGNVDRACTRLRGTILSLKGSGLNPDTLNPLTMRTIYNSVVLPKGLYGSELWSCLSHTEILKLERSHRFCIKYSQSFPKTMDTYFSLSAFGTVPIECIIDYRKLTFLGQLCRLPNKYLAKQVFNVRLLSFMSYDKQTRGFIPDVYRLCSKYGLMEVLNHYVNFGAFPLSSVWKSMLEQRIFIPEQIRQYGRLCEGADEALVSRVCRATCASQIWTLSRAVPTIAELSKTIMIAFGRLLSPTDYVQVCELCMHLCTDKISHRLCFCAKLPDKRLEQWDTLKEIYGYCNFCIFSKKSPHEQCRDILKTAIYSMHDQSQVNIKVCKLLTRMLK